MARLDTENVFDFSRKTVARDYRPSCLSINQQNTDYCDIWLEENLII